VSTLQQVTVQQFELQLLVKLLSQSLVDGMEDMVSTL
jgi:hypothetical protein